MRFFAALTLLILSPFVGEFLLGNMPPSPASWLAMLVPLLLLYGAGALLIREVTRRLGRGYPTMALLAGAYALVEEGLVLCSLFNRRYLGLHLLEIGWTDVLGTSYVWTPYVLGIHIVWSILVPIVIAEHLFPRVRREPWLPNWGLVAVTLLYLVGTVVLWVGTFAQYRFVPSVPQFGVVLVCVLACVVLATRLPRSHPAPLAGARRAVPVLAVALLTLFCGSAVIVAQNFKETIRAPLVLTVTILAALVVAAVLVRGGGAVGWTTRHTLAATTGAVATYMWAGFLIQFEVHGVTVLGAAAQVLFALIAALLVILCLRRDRAGALTSHHRERRTTHEGLPTS